MDEPSELMGSERFLALGFLVTFGGPSGLRLPHLHGPMGRRVRREHLLLLAELSKPQRRPLTVLIDEVAEASGTDRTPLTRMVEAFGQVGQLVADPSPDRHGLAPVPPAIGMNGLGPDETIGIHRPASMLVEDGSFLWFDHGGSLRARLSVDEVLAAATFVVPRSPAGAWARLVDTGRNRLSREEFDALVARLRGAGLLRRAPAGVAGRGTAPADEPPASPRERVQTAVGAAIAAHRELVGAGDRTPVVPVNTDHSVSPTSLGLLVAYAKEFEPARLEDRYDFVPLFFTDEPTLLGHATQPSIFLFSNYVWNIDENLKLSMAVKAADPASVTVHGGPSTPKYEGDAEAFFDDHPHVDICVRGEGEETFAEMLAALGPLPTDLDVLADVKGLTFRTAAGPVRTDGRDRIADLDTIASPYLHGLLDPFGAAQSGAIIETNRGCPYGCTFCDWGSATLSRIRQFSLDRVYAELEWCARNQIDVAAIADANFGILKRDVEIAERIAALKREYGFPRTVATNYAKNTVKHLRHIIEILADVEILTEGVVSLQSMDEPTLHIIRRSNIKLEKYNELSAEFRRSELPLAADIMMGLPGSTPASFRYDLQECTNRDVRVRANPTQLLPNSPMNEPSYRLEHGIVAKPGEYLHETSTYTPKEWEGMNNLRLAYYIFDNWGVLRYIARFVRQELGLHEVDFYERVSTDVKARPGEWPLIATVLQVLEEYMAPPASWGLFTAEIHRYLTDHLGLTDDTALETALMVQLAHLPAPDREFPVVLRLPHDFAAWQNTLLTARENGHRGDWEQVVPPLNSYPSADLEIHDPNEICQTDVGKPMGALAFALRSWELDSPVSRPRLGALTSRS